MTSLFGGGVPSSQAVNPERIEVATAEIEMITDVFNRLVSVCHTKCVSPRYSEGDLNKGESVCVDRCVAKFFEVNKKVGERMQSLGANAQAGGGFGGSTS